jgi:GTP-binding protein
MRFIDEAKIQISSGHGGPGCVSFRRETFIPRGGPDGGDGGAGGDVSFQASGQLSTLQDFRFKRSYQAPRGMHGSGANKTGRDGADICIRVPVGTLIQDTETGEVLADLTAAGQEWLACSGGRGGKGNAHFATATHQAPKFAQPGEEGQTRSVTLILKLLADVAIIGYPNAGKSTLISRISAARPKIADYPFTTLSPNLGVVSKGDLSFVVADIPGLIEGAHRGLGLGHRFLKHIERTGIFIHLLDGAKLLEIATNPFEEDFEAALEDFIQNYQKIREELGLFNPQLLQKPELVVLNKVDLLESDPALIERVRSGLQAKLAATARTQGTDSVPVGGPLIISAVSGQGVDTLIDTLATFVQTRRQQLLEESLQEAQEFSLMDGEPVRPLTSSVRLPDELGLRR